MDELSKMKIFMMAATFLCVFCLWGCNSDNPGAEAARADNCPKKYGCLNETFIAAFENKCTEPKEGCRLSFKELLGDMDKIYFSTQLFVNFKECTAFPISDRLKETCTMMCEYVFFETDHNIRSYLRSSCLSDLHLSGKERISFSTRAVDMVSMMDAKEPVLIRRIDEGDKKYYSIELEKTKLKKAVNDDCIHSP